VKSPSYLKEVKEKRGEGGGGKKKGPTSQRWEIDRPDDRQAVRDFLVWFYWPLLLGMYRKKEKGEDILLHRGAATSVWAFNELKRKRKEEGRV